MELLTALYEEYGQYHPEEIRERLHRAISKIISNYDGLVPVANCILLEAYRRKNESFSLDLPLEEIAKELNESIKKYYAQLRDDKSGAGGRWDDGLLGELRRLNKITVNKGGPSFLDNIMSHDLEALIPLFENDHFAATCGIRLVELRSGFAKTVARH